MGLRSQAAKRRSEIEALRSAISQKRTDTDSPASQPGAALAGTPKAPPSGGKTKTKAAS